MAAYRADIEIGVVGAARLKELQDRITRLSRAIDDVNVKAFIDNKAVQSLAEYSGAAGKAAANLRETAIQLDAAGKASGNYASAISQLVTAVGQENSALKIQNDLIKEEIELRRKAKLAASGIRETTQYAGPIGPGQASPVALRSELRGRTQQILDERKGRVELNAVLQDQFEVERQLQNSRLDEKAAQVQAELDKQAAAAAESAVQIEKLAARQADFTSRTDAAAQAAAKQTAEFYKQLRVAKEVAKINAAAGPAQLLLAPAAPGAPAIGGGARRRITGQVERLGGARTADEAAATLRLAQATDALVQSSSKIDPQYNRFLPDTAALNATGRGIQQLTTNQEEFNAAVQRGIRFEEKYNQELERRRRLGIGVPTNRMPGTTGATGGSFPVSGPIPLAEFGQTRRAAAGQALRSRAGGALGNAAIGGAFPLLFGQGGGAAAGGAIGGLVGGAFGGVGGFAGSLVGTLIGDIASRGQAVKQLAEDIGFSAEQTKQLSDAFKIANTDVEKFTGVIQNIRGVGLEIEDQAKAIQLVTRLTELYGGSFEKTGNAITAALESGKVSQEILNKITSQGINIQDALAKKYNTNRDGLLKLAKDGKISVQDFIDTLVDLGNKSGESAKKQQNAFQESYDQISTAATKATSSIAGSFKQTGTALEGVAKGIGSAFSTTFKELVRGLSDFILGLGEIGRITGAAFDGVIAKLINIQSGILGVTGKLPVLNSGLVEFAKNALAVLNPVGFLIDKIQGVGRNRPQQFGPPVPEVTLEQLLKFKAPSQAAPSGGRTKKAPKGPEDRTALLRADLEALIDIGDAENRIRDLRFTNQDALAVEVQRDKTIYDIKRDTTKQLEQANFASEKALITAIGQERILQAQLVASDELRQIEFERVQKAIEAKNVLQEAVQPILDVSNQQRIQLEDAKKFNQLVREGILPAEAERLINFERLVQSELQSLDTTIARNEARVSELETEVQALEVKADALALERENTDEIVRQIQARGGNINKIKEEIDALRSRRDAIAGAATAGPGQGPSSFERLQNELGQLQGQLNTLLDPINQVTTAAAGIGDAISSSVTEGVASLIQGTTTAKEVLSQFLKSFGAILIQQSQAIIATYIAIGIARLFAGFASATTSATGPNPGGIPSTGNVTAPSVNGFDTGSLKFVAAEGAYWSGGFSAFADGGLVTKPTLGLVGEGGEPEYIIPASKMRKAMSRYESGSRGASVIPASGEQSAATSAITAATMQPIDVRYSVERINNVDYVTAEEFQRGLAQAAQQGAAQGERRALRTLSNSPANRRRVGL